MDRLAAVYHPKKTTYATVTYTDIGGLDKGIGEGGLTGPMRNELQQVDGFVHVIRAFTDDAVPHPYDTVDPRRDLEIIDGEFLLLDRSRSRTSWPGWPREAEGQDRQQAALR